MSLQSLFLYEVGLTEVNETDWTRPLMEDTFDGGQPSMVDDIWWKMTFYGRQPSMEEDLLWKMTFDGRQLLMEDKTKFWSVQLGSAFGEKLN